MKYYLGLDVGGTNLTAGVIDENYNILSRESLPAGAGRPIERITEDMARVSEAAVKSAKKDFSDFTSWGIGMPSLVNPKTNLLVHANCFGWRNVPIYSYLDGKLPLPIYIENDANCAAIGEYAAGSAQGLKNVLMITLGTGVGSGIIIDGKLYTGGDMLGAALGHTKLVYKGRTCTCGQQGCVDIYCSATALVLQAKETMLKYKKSKLYELCENNFAKLTAKHVFDALEENDEAANRIFQEYIDLLSCALGNFTAAFRPEAIILGGGVAGAGERLCEPLRRALKINTFAAEEIGIPEIRLARRGNDAGIIGAALLERYGTELGNDSVRRRTGSARTGVLA